MISYSLAVDVGLGRESVFKMAPYCDTGAENAVAMVLPPSRTFVLMFERGAFTIAMGYRLVMSSLNPQTERAMLPHVPHNSFRYPNFGEATILDRLSKSLGAYQPLRLFD